MSGFRHLDDRVVHQGHVWHVAVARFESPDAEVFERDIVRSPGAVAALPLLFDAEGNPSVVFVSQYRPPFDDQVLEIPAGMRDVADEPTAVTAARELVEEVGLRAGRLEPLVDFYPSAGMTDSVLSLYLATDLVAVERDTHGPEEAHSQVVHLPLDTAIEMVLAGEIRDAKTIIGLLLVERQLARADRADRPAP
ncbi:MAG: NUDIX hydrolase [Actinomycetota bacterium]